VGQVRRRIAIGMELLRPGKRGIEHRLVAYAAGAAVLGKLAVVDGERKRLADPDNHGGHCASLFSTWRSSRITCSATSICAASTGSNAVRRMPSGVSSAYSSSPLPRRRRASSSLGRMTPAELPMVVILSFMAAAALKL